MSLEFILKIAAGASVLPGFYLLSEKILNLENKLKNRKVQRSDYFRMLSEFSGISENEMKSENARVVLTSTGFLKPSIYPLAQSILQRAYDKQLQEYNEDLKKGIPMIKAFRKFVKQPEIKKFLTYSPSY